MGVLKLLKKFKDWCPQSPNSFPQKLKRYSAPIAAFMVILVFTVSFSAVFSSNLFRSSTQLPILLPATNSLPASVTQIWSFKPAASEVNNLVMANGLLYLTSVNTGGSTTTLYCINPSTGIQVWNSTGEFSAYTVAGDYVYIGSAVTTTPPGLLGVVSCLNAYTGVQVWNFSYGTGFGAPLVQDGVVYVGGHYYKEDSSAKTEVEFGFVYAFNASDGAQFWNFTAPLETNFDWSPLSLYGTDVYAVSAVYSAIDSSWHSAIYAIDSFSGKELWNYTVLGQFGYGSISIGDQNIYLSSNFVNTTGATNFENASGSVYQGGILALNLLTGTKIWNYPISSTLESPIVANGTVYAIAGNGSIYALDASNGKVAWHRSIGLSIGSTLLVNGYLYVGSSDGVYCFDTVNGVTVWHFKATDFSDSSATYPTYSGGLIYVGWNGPMFFARNTAHNIYALNAYTGKILWNYTLMYTVSTSPLVANGIVYIAGNFVTTKSIDYEASGAFIALKPTVAVLPSPKTSATEPVLSNTQLIAIGVIAVILVVVIVVVLMIRKRLEVKTRQCKSFPQSLFLNMVAACFCLFLPKDLRKSFSNFVSFLFQIKWCANVCRIKGLYKTFATRSQPRSSWRK